MLLPRNFAVVVAWLGTVPQNAKPNTGMTIEECVATLKSALLWLLEELMRGLTRLLLVALTVLAW